MVHDGGPLNMSAVAQRLGVNPSNASRTCDRLVRGGLLDRRDAEDDRRNVSLTLTPSGRRLVAAMLRQRAVIFSHVVDRMDDAQRARLTKGLAAFADAARDLTEEGIGLSDDDGHLLSYLA
jgi:DNA-binding MarR family transcriptional regulator